MVAPCNQGGQGSAMDLRRQEQGRSWGMLAVVVALGALAGGGFLIVDGWRSAAADRQAAFEAAAVARAQSVSRFTQPAIDAALSLAAQIVDAKKAQIEREQIGDMVVPVVTARPEFLGVAIAFEPNGYDGKDASYQSEGKENDGGGRFVPYYYKDGNNRIDVTPLVMTVDAGIEGWYLEPLNRKVLMMVGPYIYPVNGVDVSLVSVCVPLLTDGVAFGIASVDFVMTDLLRDLDAASSVEDGEFMVLSDDDLWLRHPDPKRLTRGLMEDVGQSAYAGKAGFDEAALVTAYRSYQAAQPAAAKFVALPDGTGVYFVPVTFAGTSERWTLIATAPQGGIQVASPASLSIPGFALIGGAGLIILFIFLRRRVPARAQTVQSRRRSGAVERH
jgi:methyl-accepting chemotaxis protein